MADAVYSQRQKSKIWQEENSYRYQILEKLAFSAKLYYREKTTDKDYGWKQQLTLG